MDIPETGAIFTLGKSHLAENAQSYFFIKNDPVKRLVSGSNQSAVICESGRLFVWGENQFGQLGIGNSNDIVMKPTCVKALKSLGLKISDIDFGMGWSVILTQSNDIFFTGRNIFPMETRIFSNFIETQITDEKYSIIRKPLRLIEFDELIGDNNQNDEIFHRISAGNNHFIVLTSHGRLFAWGSNESNQLGLPDSFYSQPIEIILNNKVKMFTCGPTSTLILNDKNQLFLAGQLNDYHFEKFTELTSHPHENVMEISFLYISKANEIFITTETGNIFRGGVSTRKKNFTFQKFYDYDNEDYGPVKKLLKGSSFFAALTKANKFFTTFSESGHHLKTFREISKFKNLRTIDVAVGDRHILVLGIPKLLDSKKINSSSNDFVNPVLNKNYPIVDLNGNLKNNVLNKRISEETEDFAADEESIKNENIQIDENEIRKNNDEIELLKMAEASKKDIFNEIETNENNIVNEAIIKKEKMENGEIKEVIENDEINEKDLKENIENMKTDSVNQNEKIESKSEENANIKVENKDINGSTEISNTKSPMEMAEKLPDDLENNETNEKAVIPHSEKIKTKIIQDKSVDEIENMTKSYYNLCDDETVIPTAPPTESPDIGILEKHNEKENLTHANEMENSNIEDETKIENKKQSKTEEEEKSKYLEIFPSEADNIIIPTSDRYRKIENESSEEISDSTESKTPESRQSTSTIKLAPLKKSHSTVSPISQETPKGSVRSIKFDQQSLKSQKSSDRLVRPRTPYPDGTPQTIKHIKQSSDKNDLEEEDLLEKTSPANFADSLENTPKPSLLDNIINPAAELRDWSNDDIKFAPPATIIPQKIEKIEEITTKSSGDKSYIIKQRYTDDKLMTSTGEDDEELEVEVQSNKISLDNQPEPDEIRFINDGIDVTENAIRKLASDTTDFIESESSKSEKRLLKNVNDKKSKFVENITDDITEDILTTPDNSDESKMKTLSISNIEDDERTTASANSNKTGGADVDGAGGGVGNPFENDLDENCDKVVEETNKNIIEVGGKGRKKVKRFINGIKNTGKSMSCRANNAVKVEDEPPKYTPIDEHLEERTSKVCTIL